MARRRRGGEEGGQVFPLILVAAVGLLFLGTALFQVGRAADYRARAQTGADAAAIAAARAYGLELRLGLADLLDRLLPVDPSPPDGLAPSEGPLPALPPPLLDGVLEGIRGSRVRNAAADWAARNDSEVERLRLDPATSSVTVNARTRGVLTGLGGGDPGRARARAQLQVGGFCLPAAVLGDANVIPACQTGEQPDLSDLSFTVRLVD